MIKQIFESPQKIVIVSDILNKLPNWFGIPKAIDEYIAKSGDMIFFAAFIESKAVGFLSIKRNSQYTAEIYVMGVLPEYHRKGIGRALVTCAFKWCQENNYEFLLVKTLSETHPDPYYAITRKFYEFMGFKPLKYLDIWGKDNPCLIMITQIKSNHFKQ